MKSKTLRDYVEDGRYTIVASSCSTAKEIQRLYPKAIVTHGRADGIGGKKILIDTSVSKQPTVLGALPQFKTEDIAIETFTYDFIHNIIDTEISESKEIDNEHFYRNKKWIKKKNRILRQYQYECQESKRYGLSVKAEMVHHIYPRKEYPELAYVDWNLLPLTHQRHNTFHDRENNKIIGEGLYWQRKRRKEFEKWKSECLKPPSF